MGSIIAVGYAVGIPPEKMLEISAQLGTKSTTLSVLDFTLAGPGLLSGNRVIAIFSPFLGPIESFEELLFPCQVVATDIETGAAHVLGAGDLAQAIRASMSVPAVFAPAEIDGHLSR